jgi:hypothetical protein
MGLPKQRVKFPGLGKTNDCPRGRGRPGTVGEKWHQDRTVPKPLQALSKSVCLANSYIEDCLATSRTPTLFDDFLKSLQISLDARRHHS